MKKPIPLPETLKLYQKKEMSAAAIAEHLDVTRQAIYYRLKAAGVPTRGPQPYAKFPDKSLIERLYHG